MTIEFMLGAQIFADIVLCFAIIVFLRAVNREMKKRPPGMDKETFSEFRELIEASRCATDDLLRALNDIKHIDSALDDKMKRMHLPAKVHSLEREDPALKNLSRDKKYKAVIDMTRKGLNSNEIADSLALTAGEIRLILDLHQGKNENSVSDNNI